MLRLPATATALLAAALFVYWLAGQIGAQHKLAALEAPPNARGDYRITLAFPPERFHQVLLQEKGRLVEVRGNTVFMKDIDPAALRAIARNYWVESVARWSNR
jgi:hypothetical protein